MSTESSSSVAIAGNAITNFIGQMVPFAVAVVCIPFLLRGLGVDRFGVLNLVWVIVGYFSILDFGLGRALTHAVATGVTSHDSEHVARIVWPTLAIMMLLGGAGTVLICCLSPWMVGSIFLIPAAIQAETLTSFYLLGLSIPLVVVSSGLRGVLEGLHQFRIINWIRAPLGVFSYASPLLVLPFSSSLIFPVALIVAGRLVNTLIFLYLCKKLLSWRGVNICNIRARNLHGLIRQGGWMTISNAVGPFMVYMDRFLIGGMVSASAVAYYSTPYEMVTKLWLIPMALTGVLFPAFAYHWSADRARGMRLFKTATKFVVLMVFPFVLIIITYSHEILAQWLGQQFAFESAGILRLLALGVFLNCVAQVPFTYIQGVGRPDAVAKLHVAELLLYLPGAVFMTRSFGIEGTAIAWDARVLLDLLVLLWIVKSSLGGLSISYSVLGLIFYMVFSLGLLALPVTVELRTVFLLLNLVVFTWISWSAVMNQEEKALLMSLVKRKLRR